MSVDCSERPHFPSLNIQRCVNLKNKKKIEYILRIIVFLENENKQIFSLNTNVKRQLRNKSKLFLSCRLENIYLLQHANFVYVLTRFRF
jgi:hypothetical protein